MLTYEPIENYDKRSEITTASTGTLTSDTTNYVSAYDSSAFQNNLKDDRKDATTDNTKTIERTHGNIGVTTSQQMLQSEVDLWKAFNIYKLISEKFMFELMITLM